MLEFRFKPEQQIAKQKLREPNPTLPHFIQKTPHINFFSRNELIALHEYAGFKIVKEVVYGKPAIISKNMSGAWNFLCMT